MTSSGAGTEPDSTCSRLQVSSGACDGDAPVAPRDPNDCSGLLSSKRLEGDCEVFRDGTNLKGKTTCWKRVRVFKPTHINYASA